VVSRLSLASSEMTSSVRFVMAGGGEAVCIIFIANKSFQVVQCYKDQPMVTKEGSQREGCGLW